MDTTKLIQQIDSVLNDPDVDIQDAIELLEGIKGELTHFEDTHVIVDDFAAVTWIHRHDVASALETQGLNYEEAERRAGILDDDELRELAREVSDGLMEQYWYALDAAIEEVQPDLLKGLDEDEE
jgi:phenylpyruvate tautomerase PptA (4-oxalocrotonate tautomerase family)